MELTKQNISQSKDGNYLIFKDGVADYFIPILNGAIPFELQPRHEISAKVEFFPIEDIKMPSTQTDEIRAKLKAIEGSKVKNCAVWFRDLPEGELKRMCLSNMDELFGEERKAHSLVEAIELAVFQEDKDKEYWSRTIANLKALSV